MKSKVLKYYDWKDVSKFIAQESGLDEIELWRFWVRYIQDDIFSDVYKSLYIDTVCQYQFESTDLQEFIDKIKPALKKLSFRTGQSYIMIRYSFQK